MINVMLTYWIDGILIILGNNPGTDIWEVQVSNDGGSHPG